MKILSYIASAAIVVCSIFVSACSSETSGNKNEDTASSLAENIEKLIEEYNSATSKVENAQSFEEIEEIEKSLYINRYRIFADIYETGEDISNSDQMKIEVAQNAYDNANTTARNDLRGKELRAEIEAEMLEAGKSSDPAQAYWNLYYSLSDRYNYSYDPLESEIYNDFRNKAWEKANEWGSAAEATEECPAKEVEA